FSRGADRIDAQRVTRELQLVVERRLGVPRVLAHERARIPQLDHVVLDVEVFPGLRLPLDDDRVVARVLEVRAEAAVGLGGRRAAAPPLRSPSSLSLPSGSSYGHRAVAGRLRRAPKDGFGEQRAGRA